MKPYSFIKFKCLPVLVLVVYMLFSFSGCGIFRKPTDEEKAEKALIKQEENRKKAYQKALKRHYDMQDKETKVRMKANKKRSAANNKRFTKESGECY